MRITTWNVNGIRKPFSYQPWKQDPSFSAMFDILEADIVIFQELKIQRQDLQDNMVLIPGWDCYFSLPQRKKGYSGVAIYTRNAVCSPIRAEEGMSGILSAPSASTSYCDLPAHRQIGGYPSDDQLAFVEDLDVDLPTLDSEGRCLLLEFPAFVLIGVYCPANRDETRDDFRHGFLKLMNLRIRNLVAIGKRVILAGDINISKEKLDTANAETALRKCGLTEMAYFSMPARRLFNQLLLDGKVYEERDCEAVMFDVCRDFHPHRQGMYTCWETKVNARPSNCGARIDYILGTLEMKDWFLRCDIQEGLMGSDHCPVYVDLKNEVMIDGTMTHAFDAVNPPGRFLNGLPTRDYDLKDTLSLSARRIPEFAKRRNIRDMFQSGNLPASRSKLESSGVCSPSKDVSSPISVATPLKRSRGGAYPSTNKVLKHSRSNASQSVVPPSGGQTSLAGFFKPKMSTCDQKAKSHSVEAPVSNTRPVPYSFVRTSSIAHVNSSRPLHDLIGSETLSTPVSHATETKSLDQPHEPAISNSSLTRESQNTHPKSITELDDSLESKVSWSTLFTKPQPPRCQSHDEPCISMISKKKGGNQGRSFWMCRRPLGPSGEKERGTEWRCGSFIWCSDWKQPQS